MENVSSATQKYKIPFDIVQTHLKHHIFLKVQEERELRLVGKTSEFWFSFSI